MTFMKQSEQELVDVGSRVSEYAVIRDRTVNQRRLLAILI